MTEDNTVQNTIEELKNILDKQSFIGDPIETEDKILIPIMRMGFSFAAASGHKNNNTKNGSGAVAGIEPTSMVVVSKNTEGIDGIRVLNISKGTETNRTVSDLGLIITDLVKDIIGLNRPVVNYQDIDVTEPEYTEEEEEEE